MIIQIGEKRGGWIGRIRDPAMLCPRPLCPEGALSRGSPSSVVIDRLSQGPSEESRVSIDHRGTLVRRRPLSLATWCLLVLAVSLYAASFFLPAYREAESGSGTGPPIDRIDPGYLVFVSALIFGWPAWWANPAFWLAVALLVARRTRAALPLAVVAL